LSVLPLSAAQREGIAPDPDRAVDADYELPPGSFNNEKADAIITAAQDAAEKLTAEHPQSKDLDGLISAGIDRYEEAKADAEAWEKSKDSRAELDVRYRGHGGNTAKTLSLFLDMADSLRSNPRQAALTIAEAYLKSSRYALDQTPEAKAKPEGLDAVISDSIENATTEREMFENTKESRARLKQLWPHLTFDQAMDRFRNIDRRLHQDAIAGSAELFAAFGGAVLPHQQEAEEERHHAQALVAQARQQLPGFEQLRHQMANIIQSGHADNIQDAYRIAAHQHQRASQIKSAFDNFAISQLQEIEKSNPALAYQIVDTYKDPAFQKHVANMPHDPYARFASARTWAELKQEKAMRAARKATKALPVKSSSGAIPGGGGGSGIDAAISNALKGYY
jgi:hypothetical protein